MYLFPAGELKNVLYYKDLSQGLHNFTVIARDDDGLVDRSESHFEGQLKVVIQECENTKPNSPFLSEHTNSDIGCITRMSLFISAFTCLCSFCSTEDLHLSCRGSYNPSLDVVHIDCDANNPLLITECEQDNGEPILCKGVNWNHFITACFYLFLFLLHPLLPLSVPPSPPSLRPHSLWCAYQWICGGSSQFESEWYRWVWKYRHTRTGVLHM